MPSLDPDRLGDVVRGILREHDLERNGAPPISLPRFEIKGRLGEGATAVVYEAWDRELGRPVAIKILKENAARSATARARFHREARAAAALSHPNVVAVYDAGESGDRLYLVMEIVRGTSLRSILERGPLEVSRALELFDKIARGVAAAHERGIVHRDLTPANILLTDAGEPKVADFGLAHEADSTRELTRTGATLGTPLYMSPEQVQGRAKEVSPRTDVYALGVILYQALAGRLPHLGETMLDMYEKIVREDAPPVRAANPQVSRDLETVLLKSMEPDPSRRYADAAALAEDLRRCRAGEPVTARRVSAPERVWRKGLRHRKIVLPALAAVAVFLFAAWLLGAQRKALDESQKLLRAPRLVKIIGDVKIEGPGWWGKNPRADNLVLPGERVATMLTGPSFAALLYLNSTLVEVEKTTIVQEASTTEHHGLILEKGTLRVLVKPLGQKDAPPMIVSTTQASVRIDQGVAVLQLGKDGLRVDTKLGTALVTRVSDGRELRLAEREVAIVRDAGDLVPLPFVPEGLEEFRKNQGIDASLVAYWKLDEGQGIVVKEASGRDYDGTFQGSPTWIRDQGLTAVQFDGRSSIEMPKREVLARLQEKDYTLSAWFRPDDRPEAPPDRNSLDNAYPIFMTGGWREGLLYAPSGQFHFLHWNTPRLWVGTQTGPAGPYAPGRWYHLAGTVDNGLRRTRIFVDGRPIHAQDWLQSDPAPATSDLHWSAGRLVWGKPVTYAAKGALRHVRLYRRALDPDEIEAIYRLELAP